MLRRQKRKRGGRSAGRIRRVAMEERRGEKRRKREREGWEIERGWYVEGLSVRIIFTEKVEDDELEEETLPLFVVAGETKNGGYTERGEEENDG